MVEVLDCSKVARRGLPSNIVQSMVARRLVAAVALAVGISVSGSGCVASGEVSGDEPPRLEPAEPDWEASVDAMSRGLEQQMSPQGAWVCAYSPTMDRDWHNDVLCSDGLDSHRPHLLPGDSYITEDEMAQAAREYEDGLNAGIGVSPPHKARHRHRHGWRFSGLPSWMGK